jgi:hypothetical protein
LADYHLVQVHLLNVLPTGTATGDTTLQAYRGGSLVTSGYSFVRLAFSQNGPSAVASSNQSSHSITSFGIRSERVLARINISQTASDQLAIFETVGFFQENANIMCVFNAFGRATGGSGWVDGLRITSPVDLTANVGRLVVMGLKKS